tara:strand:- start:603 stop:707 length:105 start_codon:yes stop_codon:yes gene_type:complete
MARFFGIGNKKVLAVKYQLMGAGSTNLQKDYEFC